jgi:hypothetical protein
MSVTTTIDSVLGVVSTNDPAGAGTVTINGLQQGLTVLATGSTVTAGQAGLLTIGGSEISQVVMPLASNCGGSMFTFRSVSAKAHFLTGSQEAAGVKVFTDGTSNGSKLTLTNVIGSSVSLLSDGKSFLVIGNSGSLAFSGT